jgi:hypothetical protein
MNYHGNETSSNKLYAINQDVQMISGSISILIGLLVIPYIRSIKAYLPAVIVACNIVFGATALELGLVEWVSLKTDRVTTQTYELNFNIAVYLFFLSCSPNIFISFTYLHNSLKLMHPSKAAYALFVCWFLLGFFYVTDLLLQIWMGVYFYKHPVNFAAVIK